MSSSHKATLNIQKYCKYVNNFLTNDTINLQKQLFLSCSNTFGLYCMKIITCRYFSKFHILLRQVEHDVSYESILIITNV